MKILLSIAVVIASITATAAPKKKPIQFRKAGSIKKNAVIDSYFGPIGVGRISPKTWQVELIGMTAEDPASTSVPPRKVKTVLDISPVDAMDPDSVAASVSLLYYFYSVKTGFEYYGEEPPAPFRMTSEERPVSKLTSVSFSEADVSVGTIECLGADLEIANQTTPSTKECYKVRPIEVYEHAP